MFLLIKSLLICSINDMKLCGLNYLHTLTGVSFHQGLELEARQLTGRDPKGDSLEQTGMVHVYVKLSE